MNKNTQEVIIYLKTPQAIRERCERIFSLVCEERLNNFQVDLTLLEKCVNYVIDVISAQYPTLDIPFHSRWRHFEIGDVPRLAELEQMLLDLTPVEKTKVKFDLAIISVLLDAGAGKYWQYSEPETGLIFNRSEGLAVCSFRLFCQGFFSSNSDFPWQTDAKRLSQLDLQDLATGFQVSPKNLLVGLEGRLELLQRLGQVLNQYPLLFGMDNPRLGNILDYLLHNETENDLIKATSVLSTVLEGFGEILPGRSSILGINLGDVWPLSLLKTDCLGDEYIPFHKLSQWLTYSLLEPLEELGLKIIGLDDLTGLAEYRNGGLLIDMGH